jgi:SAM-dependent methyltransferase
MATIAIRLMMLSQLARSLLVDAPEPKPVSCPSLVGHNAAVTDWSDPAAWYEVINPWEAGDEFYLDHVMAAGRVLDVGCGTGRLLHRARDAGHAGRLCGLDPDPGMLGQARTRDDIEWVPADAASAGWDREFDLAVMAGNAFQELVDDDNLRRSLAAIRSALVDGGRFVFETRHPQARAWEGWNRSSEVRNPDGEPAMVGNEVLAVDGEVVRLSETMSGRWWDPPRIGYGALRFLDPEKLNRFIEEAGFAVEQQYGDFDRGPVTGTSKSIITIARRRPDPDN